ncbi:MAG: ATP-binding protein [bacterium]|nr:ATP-binding protein [bacterium]
MLLLSVISIFVLSSISYVIARSQLSKRSLAQLSSLVASKEEVIENRLNTDRERAALMASREEVRSALLRSQNAQGVIDTLFIQLLRQGVPVTGLTLFDSSGQTLASVGVPVSPEKTTAATSLMPIVGTRGWEGHIVYTEVRDNNGKVFGVLALRYEIGDMLESILAVPTLGDTGEVLIARQQGEQTTLLHYKDSLDYGKPLYLGQFRFASVIAQALHKKEEGVRRAESYAGKDIFVAYRYLPTLGWGVAVQVERHEALTGVRMLAWSLFGLSFIILSLAVILSSVLAKYLTEPIVRMSRNIAKLGPGKWQYETSVHTGDELELLDRSTEDLTKRLSTLYTHMESEIAAQTEQIAQQYKKDRTILESIQHGVVLVSTDGLITEINKAGQEILGKASQDVLASNITDVMQVHLHSTIVPVARHPILHAVEVGSSVVSDPQVRWSVRHNDGHLVPIMLTVTPILEGDKILGAVAVFYDTTDERRIDYLKSEFISLASHQLRTPLSSMQWYIELFQSDDDGTELTAIQEEYLAEMDMATKRMINLVEALLRAARLEGEAITPDAEMVDIKTLVNDMGSELRSMVKDKKIGCKLTIPDEKCETSTDPVLLHIVFQNLFSNAVKYTPENGELAIKLESNAHAIKIYMSDTGIGIPAQDQKRMFEKLYRADNATQVDTDGNGLGLYISKMIMESLDGDITFTSQEGKGTTFVIELPKK